MNIYVRRTYTLWQTIPFPCIPNIALVKINQIFIEVLLSYKVDVIYSKAILVGGLLHALIWNQWQLAVYFLRESDVQRSRFSLPLCFYVSPRQMQDGDPPTWIHFSLKRWSDCTSWTDELFWQNIGHKPFLAKRYPPEQARTLRRCLETGCRGDSCRSCSRCCTPPRLCAAATSCREQLRAVPQYWLKLQPHCSLLAWTRGLRNNQRARLVVVVEDVAAVIWMGVGGAGWKGWSALDFRLWWGEAVMSGNRSLQCWSRNCLSGKQDIFVRLYKMVKWYINVFPNI